ncbi:MAG: hypothetical protein L0K25_09970, partial [Acidipropionibacterium jensenii]|nr:hypothetical protein [Acidipropionibacterium jensenii]
MAKSIQQVRVTAVTRQVPGVVSIDFEPGGLSPRVFVDDHVKILLPPRGASYDSPVPLPAPTGPAPLRRTYTRRRYDPATGAVLIGGGDGMLSTGESTGRTMGHAGLADLAQETWDAIADQIPEGQTTVDVWADVSRYAQPRVHPWWNE